jgi:hypothetical protein
MKTTELQLFVALRVKEIRWRRIYRGASIMGLGSARVA